MACEVGLKGLAGSELGVWVGQGCGGRWLFVRDAAVPKNAKGLGNLSVTNRRGFLSRVPRSTTGLEFSPALPLDCRSACACVVFTSRSSATRVSMAGHSGGCLVRLATRHTGLRLARFENKNVDQMMRMRVSRCLSARFPFRAARTVRTYL